MDKKTIKKLEEPDKKAIQEAWKKTKAVLKTSGVPEETLKNVQRYFKLGAETGWSLAIEKAQLEALETENRSLKRQVPRTEE